MRSQSDGSSMHVPATHALPSPQSALAMQVRSDVSSSQAVRVRRRIRARTTQPIPSEPPSKPIEPPPRFSEPPPRPSPGGCLDVGGGGLGEKVVNEQGLVTLRFDNRAIASEPSPNVPLSTGGGLGWGLPTNRRGPIWIAPMGFPSALHA